MLFKFFSILALILSFSVRNVFAQLGLDSPDQVIRPSQAPSAQPMNQPLSSIPQAAPIYSTPVATTAVGGGCTKFTTIPGCLCDSSSGLVKINCQCQEVYKKMVYLSNTFVKYNKKRECLIDFFPGCQPITLAEGVNQPCEKLKRVIPKLDGVVRAEDFPKFCARPYKQKVDLNQGTNPLSVICSQGTESVVGQINFLP